MKVAFEFPEGTRAVMISYITEKGGSMYMNLKNVSTPELTSGETIRVDPMLPDPAKQEV